MCRAQHSGTTVKAIIEKKQILNERIELDNKTFAIIIFKNAKLTEGIEIISDKLEKN